MKHLKMEQVKALVLALEERHQLMFLTMFWHGFRVSEVVGKTGLRGKNIRDGFLAVQRLKGSKLTMHPFYVSEDPVMDESKGLWEMAEKLKDSEAAFPLTRQGAWKVIKRAGKKAGIPSHLCHPHIMKHSITTYLVRVKKLDIVTVGQYVGHANINSTRRYIEIDDEEACNAVYGVL